jgi:hypothetical protein
MARLAGFKAGASTDLGRALSDLATRVRAKGIVIVVSDLFDDEEAFANGIERLRFQGSEVIVFHVLDPQEITFALEGSVRFHGLEEGGELQTNPASIRKSYLEAFNAFRSRMRLACERANAHYVLADTGVSVAETLSAYLAFRLKTTAR